MKKIIKCLMVVSLIGLGSLVNVNANNPIDDDIREGTQDNLDNGIRLIKNAVIGNDERVSYSKVYVQKGSYIEDGKTVDCLRFATAIKGNVKSLTYQRASIGGMVNSKEKEVTTVYKGIQADGKDWYYDGTDITTEPEYAGQYYWATYTIRFLTDTYKNTDITLTFFIDDVEAGSATANLSKLGMEKIDYDFATLPNGTITTKLNDGNKTSDPMILDWDRGYLVYKFDKSELSKINLYVQKNNSKCTVLVSDDNVNWVKLGTKSINELTETATDPELSRNYIASFDVSGSYQYVKVQSEWTDDKNDIVLKYLEVLNKDGQALTCSYESHYDTGWERSALEKNGESHIRCIGVNNESLNRKNGIAFDLKSIMPIEMIDITVPDKYSFEVQVSQNKNNWTKFGDSSNGYLIKNETTYARYVKIIPTNYINEVFELTEVEFYRAKKDLSNRLECSSVSLSYGYNELDASILVDGDKTNAIKALRSTNYGAMIAELFDPETNNGKAYDLGKIVFYVSKLKLDSCFSVSFSNSSNIDNESEWTRVGLVSNLNLEVTPEEEIAELGISSNCEFKCTIDVSGSYQYFRVLNESFDYQSGFTYIRVFDKEGNELSRRQKGARNEYYAFNWQNKNKEIGELKCASEKTEYVFDLGEGKLVTEIKAYVASRLTSLSVFYSNDGTNWSVYGNNVIENEEKFDIEKGYSIYNYVTARYFKITPKWADTVFALSEVEFY